MPRATILLLTLVLFGAPGAVAQHFPPDEELELMLRYLVEDGAAPGLVLGIVEADGTRRVASYGNAELDGRPMDPRAVFEIGSITRTFTATILADMARRGEVNLDDPVSRYLPAHVAVPSRAEREITLRHLAANTSGLPAIGHYPADVYDPYADFAVEELYEFLSTAELRDTPGLRYRYSNLGMGLLGHALGRAAGRSFDDLLRERILEPLGLRTTSYAPLEGEMAEHLARGYSNRGPAPYRTYGEATYGQGGLYSTAEDLLTYLEAQLGPPETGLQRAMRDAQTSVVTPEGGSHALAWHISRMGRRTIVHHRGGTSGFTSLLAFDPKRGIGTVLLANTAGFDPDLGSTLLLPDPTPGDWETVIVPGDVLARYAGRYESNAGDSHYIRLEDEGFLTYQPPRKVRARLYSTSDTTFFLQRGPWSFTFRAGADGDMMVEMEVDEREPSVATRVTARKVTSDTPPPAHVAGYHDFEPPRGPSAWGWAGLGALAVALFLIGPFRASRPGAE
ncbi:MAG: serine hydrolase domain-containing protein [Gemmatimonadota bacterium]